MLVCYTVNLCLKMNSCLHSVILAIYAPITAVYNHFQRPFRVNL